MSVVSIITAAATQYWNAVSTFAIVNSQSLLTVLGFGTTTVAAQAVVLTGIALVSLGAIALSIYLISKVLSNLFGQEDNKGDEKDESPEDPVLDGKEVPKPIVETREARLAHNEALIEKANRIVVARDTFMDAVTASDSPQERDLDNLITMSKAAVAVAKDAEHGCHNLFLEITLDLMASGVAENDTVTALKAKHIAINTLYLSAQLYLKYASAYKAHNEELSAFATQAGAAYNASEEASADGKEGDAELYAAWEKAFNEYIEDFKRIRGKLKAIDEMNFAELKEALKVEPQQQGKTPRI